MRRIRLIGLFLVANLMFGSLGGAAVYHQFSVSIPTFRLAKVERVVSFRCDIHSAFIVQVRELSPGWKFDITNDLGDSVSLQANRIVDAAAIRDTRYFTRFLTIERDDLNASDGPPFSIDLHITIATDESGDRTRTLEVPTAKVILAATQSTSLIW
jgi:hypothetical protein